MCLSASALSNPRAQVGPLLGQRMQLLKAPGGGIGPTFTHTAYSIKSLTSCLTNETMPASIIVIHRLLEPWS